jgi:hypothetical protein
MIVRVWLILRTHNAYLRLNTFSGFDAVLAPNC